MKKLMIGSALALAALAASPAFAATHHMRTHAAPMAADTAYGAYAADGGYGRNAVIVNGRVVGADPDPNVRYNLMRDPDLQAP